MTITELSERISVKEWILSSKSIAIIIAIDDYHNKNINNLNFAVKDANAIKELLLGIKR